MYGLVNQAIRDLVVSKFGEEKWESVCAGANITDREFVSMQYYPDSVTYQLVASAASQLEIPAKSLLYEFGKYWVLYTAQEGYGPLLDLFGTDLPTCLSNLNNLHTRMGMTLPHLTPPRFTMKEIGKNQYSLGYYSKRSGLSPMVRGLIDGLAKRMKTEIEIAELEPKEDGHTEFVITIKDQR